jgi:hypothetical protein
LTFLPHSVKKALRSGDTAAFEREQKELRHEKRRGNVAAAPCQRFTVLDLTQKGGVSSPVRVSESVDFFRRPSFLAFPGGLSV